MQHVRGTARGLLKLAVLQPAETLIRREKDDPYEIAVYGPYDRRVRTGLIEYALIALDAIVSMSSLTNAIGSEFNSIASSL